MYSWAAWLMRRALALVTAGSARQVSGACSRVGASAFSSAANLLSAPVVYPLLTPLPLLREAVSRGIFLPLALPLPPGGEFTPATPDAEVEVVMDWYRWTAAATAHSGSPADRPARKANCTSGGSWRSSSSKPRSSRS